MLENVLIWFLNMNFRGFLKDTVLWNFLWSLLWIHFYFIFGCYIIRRLQAYSCKIRKFSWDCQYIEYHLTHLQYIIFFVWVLNTSKLALFLSQPQQQCRRYHLKKNKAEEKIEYDHLLNWYWFLYHLIFYHWLRSNTLIYVFINTVARYHSYS